MLREEVAAAACGVVCGVRALVEASWEAERALVKPAEQAECD